MAYLLRVTRTANGGDNAADEDDIDELLEAAWPSGLGRWI